MSVLPCGPARVQLLVTCLVDAFFPETAYSVISVLRRLGVEVDVPARQTCCGQPEFNSGHVREARRIAAHTVDVFSRSDAPVVVPSGSCADMIVHHFPALLEGDPRRRQAARDLAARTYELSQFLVDVLGVEDLGARCAGCLTYHASCHGLRGLGLRRQPEALLSRVEAPARVPLAEAEVCCGFGGAFAVKMGELSSALLERKLDDIERSGADVVAVTDVSCLMHMEGGLRRRGSARRVVHLADLLAGRY
jgi:L-lactate dehydrogenase complex protein LldE